MRGKRVIHTGECRHLFAVEAGLTILAAFMVGFSSFASPPCRELNAWLARDLAAAGIVLLENKDSALPLKADEEVALVGITGYFCHRMGWGSGDMLAHDPVQIDAGLEKAGVKIDADFAKLYRDDLAKRDYSRLNRDWDKWTRRFDEPKGAHDAFAKLAEGKRAKKCVVVIGRGSGESADIPEAPGGWRLHAEEERLLADACAAFDSVVVLLNAPGVLDTSFMDKYPVKALVFVPFLGETTGDAVASILTGKVNPSGRTVDTWAKRYGDYPTTDCWQTSEIEYYEETVGYRHFDINKIDYMQIVRYPFGHGLSYTTFELTPAKVERRLKNVKVPVTVRNTGKVAGADVVMCWFDEGPLNETRLCAFAKTPVIAPGASLTVALSFEWMDIASYNEDEAQWEVHGGAILVSDGGSRDNRIYVAKLDFDEPIVVQKVTNRFRGKSAAPARRELAKPSAFVKMDDVLGGKATVEDLVAQFTDEELAAVVNGRIFDGEGYAVDGGTGVGGVKKGRVDCEAGETWSSEKYGFGAITMADGPSGVRLGNFGDPREKYNAKASAVVSWPCATALAQGWLRTQLRVLLRRPTRRGSHGRGGREGRADEHGRDAVRTLRDRQALRRQQPGVRARVREQHRRRKDAARNLPQAVRDSRQEGASEHGHVELQPSQRRLLRDDVRPDDGGAARGVGLRRFRDDGLVEFGRQAAPRRGRQRPCDAGRPRRIRRACRGAEGREGPPRRRAACGGEHPQDLRPHIPRPEVKSGCAAQGAIRADMV